MPFKMINKTIGISDPLGVTTKVYEVDEVIDDSEEWKKPEVRFLDIIYLLFFTKKRFFLFLFWLFFFWFYI